MTRVRLAWGPEGGTLTAEGHATGVPAACAGVSALLYALAEYLDAAGLARGVTLEKGAAHIACADAAPARAAMAMALTGLRQIARRYPEAVEAEEGIPASYLALRGK